jgi:hypothetical protein
MFWDGIPVLVNPRRKAFIERERQQRNNRKLEVLGLSYRQLPKKQTNLSDPFLSRPEETAVLHTVAGPCQAVRVRAGT